MFKASNIATPEEIFKACSDMQPFIESHYKSDNGTAVSERAATLESYMALSGKLLADAKYHFNQALSSEFIGAVKQVSTVAPSVQKKYIDSLCKDYQYLVDWCGRINAACTHQIDMCRSTLSTIREEMRQTAFAR